MIDQPKKTKAKAGGEIVQMSDEDYRRRTNHRLSITGTRNDSVSFWGIRRPAEERILLARHEEMPPVRWF